jgi:hypothetical protein
MVVRSTFVVLTTGYVRRRAITIDIIEISKGSDRVPKSSCSIGAILMQCDSCSDATRLDRFAHARTPKHSVCDVALLGWPTSVLLRHRNNLHTVPIANAGKLPHPALSQPSLDILASACCPLPTLARHSCLSLHSAVIDVKKPHHLSIVVMIETPYRTR